MRFLVVLALAAISLSANAFAQKYPKTKPTYTQEKQVRTTAPPAKLPATHSAADQELRRTEQSGTKAVASTHRQQGRRPARTVPLPKAQQEKNPPINFGAAGGGGHANQAKKSDSLKGRLRQKGSH